MSQFDLNEIKEMVEKLRESSVKPPNSPLGHIAEIEASGPRDFSEAQFVHRHVSVLMNRCLLTATSGTMPELTRYMDELQKWIRWLPMVSNRFYEERQRLATEYPCIVFEDLEYAPITAEQLAARLKR